MGSNEDKVQEDVNLLLQQANSIALFQTATRHFLQGDLEEALRAYDQTILLDQNFIDVHNSRGKVLLGLGRLEESLAAFEKAIQLNPNIANLHYIRGHVLRELGFQQEALGAYERAIKLQSGYAEAYNAYGNTLRDMGYQEKALAAYELAIKFQPESAEAHYNLGNLYNDQGKHAAAFACFRKAISINPDAAEPRWALVMTQIPVIYSLDKNPATCRSEFSRELAELIFWFDTNEIQQGYQSVGVQKPFYLTYQEENNCHLLSQYGALCTRLMENWMIKQGITRPDVIIKDKIRLGIVSAHIRNHSIWNALVKGWLEHLDHERFELHVFSISSIHDEESAWAKDRSDFFAQGVKGLRQWAEIIIGRQCDVLIYPEIGIDSMTVKLASLRLAPVQITAWGHPETTGLPTMDYFLSAQEFEPPGAQEGYTERLVSLPNLGCCYRSSSVEITEPDFDGLGINMESPVFICPGTPFKYAPQHDWVFVEIARRMGQCQFVCFTHRVPGWSEKLRQRLEGVFARTNLDFNDYVIFVPWQKQSDFYGLMKHADVFLDTIGFSGFNTVMQAVECRLPVVTREGRFMRGRLASGVLRRMGLPELIAHSGEDYVALVVRLAQDTEYRKYIKQYIDVNCDILYEDLAPVHALEEFMINTVKNAKAPLNN